MKKYSEDSKGTEKLAILIKFYTEKLKEIILNLKKMIEYLLINISLDNTKKIKDLGVKIQLLTAAKMDLELKLQNEKNKNETLEVKVFLYLNKNSLQNCNQITEKKMEI